MSDENDPLNNLQRGMQRADTYIVEAAHNASVVGSGSVPVLATPWLIAYMEQTAHRLVAAVLPEVVHQRWDPDHHGPSLPDPGGGNSNRGGPG